MLTEFERVERIRKQMYEDLIELGDYLARKKYMELLKGYVDMCAAGWVK